MPKGMFVDTSICTGCKACQVACKEWNALPHEPGHFRFDPVEKRPVAVNFTGNSYDNTGALSATDWRHVRFIEQFSEDRSRARWFFSSDSCKHCNDAGCLNACPTGAIVRTDLGNVFIQQDVCIGCKYCIPSCPYGVISLSERYRHRPQVHALQRPHSQRAGDRLREGVPDGVDLLRRGSRPQERRRQAPGAAQGPGLRRGEHLRVQGGRRPQRVLPFPRSPAGVRPAGGGGGPAEASSGLVGGDDRRRVGPRRQPRW